MAEDPEIDNSELSETPEGEGSNRTFIIIAAILGGLFLVGLCAVIVFAGFILPSQRNTRATAQAAILATNTQMVLAATGSAMPTNTPLPTPTFPPTNTPAASPTPLVADTATPAPSPTPLPPTETLPPAETAAGTTATATKLPSGTAPTAAGAAGTGTPPTPTKVASRTPSPVPGTGVATATPIALPSTGFADRANLPGLILSAIALIVVVVFARQLRMRLR